MNSGITRRLFIVESNELLLAGIRSILAGSGFQIINVRTYEQLLTLLELRQPQSQDVLVFGECASFKRGRTSLLQMIEEIIPYCQDLPILIVGNTNHGWLLHALFRYPNVRGYLHVQDDLAEVLSSAIQKILLGRLYLSYTAQQQFNSWESTRLSPQEIEVLSYLAMGFNSAQINGYMNLPDRKIYRITERLREIFGVSSNEGIIVEACRSGILAIR